MLEADTELVASFDTRFAELKDLDPPVADGPFKTYLNDRVSKLTSLKNEFKTKRRSALRRADKDEDPLAVRLANMTETADTLTHLLKCIWTNRFVSPCFLWLFFYFYMIVLGVMGCWVIF